MSERPKYMLRRDDLRARFSETGRRLQTTPPDLKPALSHQYKELQEWLRMLKARKKWRPVQLAYDKAYQAALAAGQSKKQAHLRAKCSVQNEFDWVHERNLGRDAGRGIIPYD